MVQAISQRLGSKIDFSNPAIPQLLFIPSHHSTAMNISSRSRLVKRKLLEFTADGQIQAFTALIIYSHYTEKKIF